MNDLTLPSLQLFAFEKQNCAVSTKILNLTIQFVKDSDGSLYGHNEQSGYSQMHLTFPNLQSSDIGL